MTVVRNDADRRVDVLVDGKPFTSYIWPTTLKKPVLYPIRTAAGTLVTRGFPLDPRAGERVDHPHHVGLWFNYGDVNGLDFWNNSDAIAEADRPKMGTDRAPRDRRGDERAVRRRSRPTCDWVDARRQRRADAAHDLHVQRRRVHAGRSISTSRSPRSTGAWP